MRHASLVVVLALAAAPSSAREELAPPALLDDAAAPERAPPPADAVEGADDDGIRDLDIGVPLWSVLGCVGGGALAPILPLALAVPAAVYVTENETPLGSDAGCASAAAVFACTGFGVAAIAPCSALGATLAGTGAAFMTDRDVWRPLIGGVPGVLCAVLSPLSCLCFPLPLGSVLAVAGLALGMFGGPLAIVGASVIDAQMVERVLRLFDGDKKARVDDDVADQMHY